MKFKKLLHQKKETKESSSKEISTIKESTGKSTNVEIYSEPYQTDIEKFRNKEILIPTTLESWQFKQMVKNQEFLMKNTLQQGGDVDLLKLTIPILENAFPKLLIPYIITFEVPGVWYGLADYPVNITCPDKFSSQSTMIDTIGSEVSYSLDKVPLARFMHIGEHKSTVPTLTQSNYLAEDLDKISDGLKSHNSNDQSKDREDIYLICNDSDEAILQSTKRYYRINNSEFKDKSFKVGIFANKYIVFATPLINQGKLFMFNSSFRSLYFFGLYTLNLVCKGNYKAIARIFSVYTCSLESLQTYCKLIYLH